MPPKKSLIDKLEEAAGIEQSKPMPQPSKPKPMPQPKPNPSYRPGMKYPMDLIKEDRKLRDKSTEGSPPFSDAELKQGYRKMGKG